jgi:molecular chaperone DnaJ
VSKRDYYEILGIQRSATDIEIKSAYRKLAMKYHPDRNPGDKAAEDRFKEAAEAYAILADAEKRTLYDRFGHAGVSSAAGAGFDPTVFTGFEDILGGLGDIFGFADLFGGGRRRGGPQRGADLRYDLEISFEEAAHGTETTIQIPRSETCETCNGSGAAAGSSPTVCSLCHGQGQVRRQQGFFAISTTCPQCRGTGRTISKPCQTCRGAGRVTRERKITVKIPPGIAAGQQLRLQGEGESGGAGGPAGHLYVVVHVQEHEFFRRDGTSLFCEIPVNFTTLALGGEVQVPTLDGNELVKIPESTTTGTTLRLRGKGLPDVSGGSRGDLFVTVQVQTPRKLTREQRHLLEQLAKVLPKEKFEPRLREEQPDERNLFDRVKDIFG